MPIPAVGRVIRERVTRRAHILVGQRRMDLDIALQHFARAGALLTAEARRGRAGTAGQGEEWMVAEPPVKPAQGAPWTST